MIIDLMVVISLVMVCKVVGVMCSLVGENSVGCVRVNVEKFIWLFFLSVVWRVCCLDIMVFVGEKIDYFGKFFGLFYGW